MRRNAVRRGKTERCSDNEGETKRIDLRTQGENGEEQSAVEMETGRKGSAKE